MKTSLKAISLLLSVGLPVTVIADFAGVHLPTALDSTHAFNAFVVVLTLLTVVADYSESARSAAVADRQPAGSGRQNLAKNETEQLRLAA